MMFNRTKAGCPSLPSSEEWQLRVPPMQQTKLIDYGDMGRRRGGKSHPSPFTLVELSDVFIKFSNLFGFLCSTFYARHPSSQPYASKQLQRQHNILFQPHNMLRQSRVVVSPVHTKCNKISATVCCRRSTFLDDYKYLPSCSCLVLRQNQFTPTMKENAVCTLDSVFIRPPPTRATMCVLAGRRISNSFHC